MHIHEHKHTHVHMHAHTDKTKAKIFFFLREKELAGLGREGKEDKKYNDIHV